MPRTVTVPAAKAALLARLRGLDDLNGVLVEWGLPVRLPQGRERVYLARTVNLTRRTKGTFRQETYGLELVVEVHRADRDGVQATEERMWEIVTAIEESLVADNYLTVVGVVDVFPSDELVYAYSDGWIARDSVRVDVAAVL